MLRSWAIPLVAVLATCVAACAAGADAPGTSDATSGPSGSGGSGGGTGGSGGSDGGAPPSLEVCGNGLDDDGNGLPDDGCACEEGAEQDCFAGEPALAGVGACEWGKQTCEKSGGEVNSGQWGACTGSGAPSPDTCGDGIDNDCNGTVDDGCACPAPTVAIGGLDNPLGCAASTAQATLTFDQPVTGVVAGDTVTISGGANVDAIMGGPAVYTVSLSGLTGVGPYTLSVLPVGSNGHIAATCGTDLAAAATDDVLTSPASAPTVSISVPNPVGCGAVSTQATLTFSQAVTGVAANDTVTASGGATINGIQGGPTVYTVDVGSLGPGGSYGVHVAPVGPSSVIKSSACQVQLGAPANASFTESTQDVVLAIAPGPSFTFGPVPLGMSAEETFTVTPVGGGVANNVVPTLPAPFGWKGGVYPGIGGTCGATINAPCTMVVAYTPGNTCTDFAQLTLGYSACNGSASASVFLSGFGKAAGEPTSCPTSNTLYVSPAGNDGNSGAAANAPKLTIGAALAIAGQGTEIHVAEGTYPETLTVSGCRKIFGGYDATFTMRDPNVYPTHIVASVPNGAVISFPGASLHLDGCHVQNTAPTGEGLYYFQGGSVISNNVIQGADYGMYFWQHSCGAIHDNVLSGAQGGLYFWQSRVPVYNNTAYGSNNAVTTWQNQGLLFSNNDLVGGSSGIQTWQEQGMVFDGNRISGTSNGVNGWQSTGVVYRNNYLYGPSAAITESSDLVTVANNTIVGPATGLQIGASDYVVVNNIFVGTSGGATGVSGNMPSSIENNLFLGLGTFVSVSGKPPIVTAAGVNALDGSSIASLPSGCTLNVTCWTARAAGNVSTALMPSAVFTSMAGADASLATLSDDDWSLLTNDVAITQGGKDTSQSTCGSYEAPRACGNVEIDFAGLARSVPYSIGAHEK